MRRILFALGFLLLLLAIDGTRAQAQSVTYTVTRFTTAGGSGLLTGGSYTLGGTAGQADANAGALGGGAYTLSGGFWPAAATNADLASLVLSAGTLTPPFGPATLAYTATVPSSVSALTVTATLSDANATLRIMGSSAISGTPFGPIPLVMGPTIVTLTVTAADTTTTKTYTVTVTRMTPTAATVMDFSGMATPAGVSLSWTTIEEIGLLGFHLYRGATVDDPGVRLTGELIPAQGASAAGSFTYSFTDAAVLPPGGSAWYSLELVDVGGATREGPLVVQAPAEPGELTPRLYLPVIEMGGSGEQQQAAAPEPGGVSQPAQEASASLNSTLYLPAVSQ